MLTQERLKELLYLDENGDFRNKVDRNSHAKAGEIAGNCNRNGTIRIRIEGVGYGLARLLKLWHTGVLPPLPKRKPQTPPISQLRELVHYDPLTGILTRREDGAELGYQDKTGYRNVRLLGHTLGVHRVIWAVTHGYWPHIQIDHKDGDKINNRYHNLREATPSQQIQHQNLRSQNTSGVKGVSWHKDREKWRARVRHDGTEHHFGYFDTIEEATNVVREKRVELHGRFANHGEAV